MQLCAVVEADDVASEVVAFRELQQQEQDAVKDALVFWLKCRGWVWLARGADQDPIIDG